MRDVHMLDNTDNGSWDTTTLYDAACLRELSPAFPGIAHDMRGILNKIALNHEMLKDAREVWAAGSNTERYRDIALQQERHLELSIRSLSEFLDREDGPPHTLDLNALCTEVHAMLKSYARHAKKYFVWTPLVAPVVVLARAPSLRRALLHIELALIRATAIDGKLVGQIESTGGRTAIRFQGKWDPVQQTGLMRVFSEENGSNKQDVSIVKARESLRAVGGEGRGGGAGRGGGGGGGGARAAAEGAEPPRESTRLRLPRCRLVAPFEIGDLAVGLFA